VSPVCGYDVTAPVFAFTTLQEFGEQMLTSILYDVGEPLGTVHERLICEDDTAVALRYCGGLGAFWPYAWDENDTTRTHEIASNMM